MFGFFKTWSRRRERRDIFVYHDGTQDRRIDPWDAWLKLWSDPEVDFKTAHPACARGDVEAMRQIEALVCRVFRVQEYDADTDQGLTILELHGLLNSFSRYILDLKKKRDFLPMASRPTVSASSRANSTTPPESDSSSTENAPTSSEPR